MPTQHVEPTAHELLQDVANALLKARKIVVVTGAGISTNSGIPDFRSENGLYSLIQVQFDAASQRARTDNVAVSEDEHPSKRRRISRRNSPDSSDASPAVSDESEVCVDTICVEPELPTLGGGADKKQPESIITDSDALDDACIRTPRSKPPPLSAAHPTTSPLSSPPAEDLMIPPSSLRPGPPRRLANVSLTLTSPLSSPPPGLFDPFLLASPDENMSRRSSTALSEVDESPTPLNTSSASQPSNSGRNSLPNMKGKDLFDASIWSDPTRTSVFYQFATSLRQKVRDAEPTSSHKFIGHLRDRGKLVRCYTQNIDQIEEKVGLSTSLLHGPGSRGRFSRRSTAHTSLLSKMVEEVSGGDSSSDAAPSDKPSQSGNDSSQQTQADPSEQTSPPLRISPKTEQPDPPTPDQTAIVPPPKREPPQSGVECVFLHGSLELLRCFLCGQVCSWDVGREMETLSGQQPECPHCLGATEARKERGKRALGVGKLRPDIVLYGEEHPNAHLISPIVTHDLALYPDMLLILGTSLRVHGLKVMVREFAKTVRSRGGKVVFVNFTKPPESSWGDIIDYWVQWDCDAWVADLGDRIPKLWQIPEPPKPKKKRDPGGVSEGDKEEKKKPLAANPVALRDTKVTGAYCTLKILKELRRITCKPPPERRASMTASTTAANPSAIPVKSIIQVAIPPLQKEPKARPKRLRKSAPCALEKPKRTASTLNPNHGRSMRQVEEAKQDVQPSQPIESMEEFSSILYSVKANPRIRKRKMIDGEEVVVPTVGKRRAGSQSLYKPYKAELKLPPLRPEPASPYEKPQPLEPRSPPDGPLASLSVNLRVVMTFERPEAFFLQDPLVGLLEMAPHWKTPGKKKADKRGVEQHGIKEEAEANAALALAGLRTGSPVMSTVACPIPRGLEGELMNWGATWRR